MIHPSSRLTVFSRLGLAVLLAWCAAALATGASPKFYPDDPLSREPETQNASGAQPEDVGLIYELSWNLFVTSRRPSSNVQARNVNTIDEVPDSSWFTNRILPRTLSVEELVRGPNTGTPPNPERWVVTREKSAGYSPGFTAKDANGETWFVSFDAPGSEEGSTASIIIASKMFWILGYNQVETYITKVDPTRITIDPKATMKRPNGERTPLTRSDLNAILERVAPSADGTYRAAAGRLLPGKILGPFRYEGTRPDDPNDIVDHQHRRELRALRVFGGWTNLTDLKAGNTLDTLVTENGQAIVKHYLQDVGSTFGVGGVTGPRDWDEGFEYFYEGEATLKRLMSFGFALSPWQTTPYIVYPSVGRWESEAFDPETWKPHTPTAAYMEMRADDAFWAARRVAAFDDDLLAALVHTGQFSDAAAEQHFLAILKQRRDKIARTYLPALNPIVNPHLSADGELSFDNAAVALAGAKAPSGYSTHWARFDNATAQSQQIGDVRSPASPVKAQWALPSGANEIVQIDVVAEGSGQSAWEQPVHLFFRRTGDGWQLVGLERQVVPQTSADAAAKTEHREW